MSHQKRRSLAVGKFMSMWNKYKTNRRLKEELFRLAVAVAWFAGSAFLMAMVQINGDSLHAQHVRDSLQSAVEHLKGKTFNAIHDISFYNLPNLPASHPFNPDHMLHSFIFVSVIAAAIHWNYLTLIARSRRFLCLFGAGYLLRMLTLASTVLPPSDPLCIPIERNFSEMLILAPQLLVGRARTCTDKLFSGHTLVATLLLWFWWDARSVAGDGLFSFWRIYAMTHAFVMVISSLVGWNHFTVDVVLAFIISSLLFWLYKSILVVGSHRKFADSLGTSLDSQEFHCLPNWLVAVVCWCDGADLEPTLEAVRPPEQMQEV